MVLQEKRPHPSLTTRQGRGMPPSRAAGGHVGSVAETQGSRKGGGETITAEVDANHES